MNNVQDATKCCAGTYLKVVPHPTGFFVIARYCDRHGLIGQQSRPYRKKEDAVVALQKGVWKGPAK